MSPVASFLRGCSVLPCGLRELFTYSVFWVNLGLGSAGLLALPPSLPAAPTPAVQNPHREGSDLSGIARSQIDFTLISEKKHFLYSRTFLQVYIFFVLSAKYLYGLLEKEGRKKEKYQCERGALMSFHLDVPVGGDRTHNLRLCPAQESNPQPFGEWDITVTN